MEGIIAVVAIILVIAYIGFAIWFICTRDSVRKSVGASVGCICGGLLIIPFAQIIATILCWGIVVIIALAIIAGICSGS